MDEVMEVATTEATMPQEEVTAAAEATAEAQAEESAEEPTEDTTPPTEEAPTEAADPSEQEPAAPMTLPVKFRHETHELSMEEATSYAQMGMLYEQQQPMLDKLRMMAAGRGQGLEEFIDAWSAADERAFMKEALNKTGGDQETAEKLKKLEWEDRRKACEARVQQEQKAEEDERAAVTSRLAAEFGELQAEFPEVTGIDMVPDSVVKDAINNNRHLLDAYLRYVRSENKKIEHNRAAQSAASKATAGSQKDAPPTDNMDAATAAMMRGVRSVFE